MVHSAPNTHESVRPGFISYITCKRHVRSIISRAFVGVLSVVVLKASAEQARVGSCMSMALVSAFVLRTTLLGAA